MSKSKVLWLSILVMVFTIPLSQFINSCAVAAACLLAIIFGKYSGESLVNYLKKSWDLHFYVLALLVGLIYTEDLKQGMGVIETSLSFLVVPIIFSRLSDFDESEMNSIFNAFGLGLFLACVICLINAGIVYQTSHDPRSFFFYNLTDVIGFQPTYFAYYLIFAITFLLYRLYFQTSKENPFLISAVTIFFFCVLILTGGQTAFVGLLLVFGFFILRFLTTEKTRETSMGTALVAFMIIGLFLAIRIHTGEVGLTLNDAWDRLVLWDSALDAIPNPLFGVGTGDYKIILNQYYSTHNLMKYANENYNSHNQFIQSIFSNGLLGIVSLAVMIGRPLYQSVKINNLLGILLIFPFAVYGVTEVFLGRYQGVVFFALVHQLCVLQNNSINFARVNKVV